MPNFEFCALHKMNRGIILAGVVALHGLTFPRAAMAEDVSVDNSVLVERLSNDVAGKKRLILEPAQSFRPGDRLIYVLTFTNSGSADTRDLVLTNPLPREISFQGTADGREIVSADGGRTWGTLGALTIRQADGSNRIATAEDVTHVRWTIANGLGAGESGKRTFRAIVRR